MLGVFLAFVLVAEIRNGMQLANVAGYTQDIVIGVLLLTAILIGNLVRSAQTGGLRLRRPRLRRKEVIGSDPPDAVMSSNVE
jgi:ribose/xylose/arabinose/galactoside ABC-type transport system permease subunit